MKLQKIVTALVLFLSLNVLAQNALTEITTDRGIRYITTSMDYQITGTYSFYGAEPPLPRESLRVVLNKIPALAGNRRFDEVNPFA